MIPRLIHSPKPVPLSPLVVKKGSKMCEIVSVDIPAPVSAMVRVTPGRPVFQSVLLRLRMRRRRWMSDMASMAFEIKLLKIIHLTKGNDSGSIDSWWSLLLPFLWFLFNLWEWNTAQILLYRSNQLPGRHALQRRLWFLRFSHDTP